MINKMSINVAVYCILVSLEYLHCGLLVDCRVTPKHVAVTKDCAGVYVIGTYLLTFHSEQCTTHTPTNTDLKKYAATPANQIQRCILTNYFDNCNFNKAQIIRSLMMVIEPKHLGAVLM